MGSLDRDCSDRLGLGEHVMKPELDLHGLEKPKAWEYAARFGFGGVVAVIASLTSKALGDFAGGLALAFPAILPAALTLVKKHDGRQQAADDARGARLGSVGLMVFALTVLLLSKQGPWLALPVALFLWAAVAGLAWWLIHGRR